MADRDAYEVLQVHPKANQLVIQAAYRVLAGQSHPDRDPSSGATRRMVELNAVDVGSDDHALHAKLLCRAPKLV